MFYFRAKKGEYAHPKSVFSYFDLNGESKYGNRFLHNFPFFSAFAFPRSNVWVFLLLFFYFVIVVFLFCSSSNVPQLNYQQSFYFLFWFGLVLTILSRAGDLQRGILRRQF